MADRPHGQPRPTPPLADKIGSSEPRKLKARRGRHQSIRFGLGMMGLVGWSIAIPTLAGALLGLWIDRHRTGSASWTLMLLILGVAVGCLNAWHWVRKAEQDMREEEEDDDE